MKWLFFILISFLVLGCTTTESGSKICDPACDDWKVCNEGSCELKAEMCDSNTDCKDTTKPTCDKNHICVMAPECTINDDCKEATKPICENSVCVAAAECDPVCDNTWQTCINKSCETKEGFCAEDSDCKDSTKPACENHECVALDESCGEQDKCPEGKHCEEIDGYGKKCRHNKPENTYTRCTDGYDNDQNGHFDCDDWECQKLPVCEPKCDDVTCENGKVCEPTTGNCITVELMTIKQVRDAHVSGTIYKTKGIVVAGDKDGLYIQDSSDRGIYVYINPGSGAFITQIIGDEVTVAGVFKDYHGFAELINPDISEVTHNHAMPSFKEIDAADLENLDIYESMLVKFKNPNFKVTIAHQSGGPNTFLEDANQKEFYMRNDIYDYDLTDGDILTQVQGVLKFAKDKFRVLPRKVEDLELLAFTCTPECNAGSEICIRDHDSVGKCELACTRACESYETCVANGNDAECQLNEGMCYIDDNGTTRESDDFIVGCEAHFNCIDNHCVEINNSVPNGDLEEWDDDNTATGWTYEYGDKADTKVYKETTLVCAGTTSAKVRKTAADKKPDDSKNNEFYSPPFAIDVTKNYNVSVQIIDNDPNVKARIFWKFYDETDHNAECVMENGAPNCSTVNKHQVNFFTSDFDGCKTYSKPSNWDFFMGIDDEERARIRTVRIGVRLLDQDSTEKGYIYVDDFRVDVIE